ncbi:alpha/beta fold hydrolase [Fictibacillus phosphorivorans]|uniref:alpha/beta fold hydrolase n=1 Tax=Fictibacillus phosphorivorans TaxID=1221500 RepID=UPI0021B36EF4|nr:alpha/beta hydrolase [Fictibacillus phosphorivorans]
MKYKDDEYQLLVNGISHWVKIEGSQNRTVPLVIIHGGPGGNHYVFERTVGPKLAEERTVIYYEQRGCGRSSKPQNDNDYSIETLVDDYIKLMNQIGVEKVDVLGYSFGGELALEIAYTYPDIINKIILSAPSLIFSDTVYETQIKGFKTVADKELIEKIEHEMLNNKSLKEKWNKVWSLVDSDTVDSFLFEDKLIAKRNRKLWQESGLINTGLMMKALEKIPPVSPLRDRLTKITNDTLILTGVHDRNTGLSISNIMKQKLPNSRLELFQKSAHFPDLEEGELFVKKALNFLKNGDRQGGN